MDWEHELQLIGNNDDIERFQTNFAINKHFFETEINKKEQRLTALREENYKKLRENTKLLRDFKSEL